MAKPPPKGKQAAPGVTFIPEPSRLSPHSRQLPGRGASGSGEMGEMGEQGERGEYELPASEREYSRDTLESRMSNAARQHPNVTRALGVAGAVAEGRVKGSIPLNKRTRK